MKRVLDFRWFIWSLLALPAMLMVTSGGEPMDMLHPTGEMSARLLILALAITPLMIATGRARWVRWLLARRRYIGVAAFAYAVLHLVYYVIDMGRLDHILAEALALGIWTGWAAFAAMLVMAATSNDAAMRALKAGWKRLQRLAYPAAVLTLVHWIAVHNGLTAALFHFGPLAALEIFRIVHNFNRKKDFSHA